MSATMIDLAAKCEANAITALEYAVEDGTVWEDVQLYTEAARDLLACAAALRELASGEQ